ncbi:hypothetical protein G7Y89_g7462 [Cudoniella acicularis]|uniref:F-box domain-containing protein n=1 Tax=Cudoniella acicularis TaxID=354080 RepID=A0A8H4RKR9_9HELO|nr:hypothetical protein G7Y89_g7462 [Cudoniella acicularis]
MTTDNLIRRLPVEVADKILGFLLGNIDTHSIRGKNHQQRLASILPRDNLADVLNFRLVNTRFNDFYKLRFNLSLYSLPVEVVDKILEFLLGNNGETDSIRGKGHARRLASIVPRDNWTDVLSFRLVHSRFNDIYKLRFYPSPRVFSLPDEVMEMVLDHFAHNPRTVVNIEERNSLSLESFSSIRAPVSNEPVSNETSNLWNFRLTCRKFAQLGVQRQFARVSARFTVDGFATLQSIAKQRHIRDKVKKLTYLVPRFYLQDRAQFQQLLLDQRKKTSRLEKDEAMAERATTSQTERAPPAQRLAQIRHNLEQSRKSEKRIADAMGAANAQRNIIHEHTDIHGIMFAVKVFKNLEQIRLLRLEDEVDKEWIRFLRTHPNYWSEFSWPHAYEHAMSTLAKAYLQSNTEMKRFSSRFVDPQEPFRLTTDSKNAISQIAKHLECLEVQLVHDHFVDLNERVAQLSDLSEEILSRTTGHLKGLHVGYGRPVSVPLETVFHHLVWKKLTYIGFHAWCLTDDEVIRFLLRHPKLKGLRMRYVLLRHGSRWDRVLKVIRRELTELKWVSLLGIGYATEPILGGMAFAPPPNGQRNYIDNDSDFDSDMHWDDDSHADESSSEGQEPSDGDDAQDEDDEDNGDGDEGHIENDENGEGDEGDVSDDGDDDSSDEDEEDENHGTGEAPHTPYPSDAAMDRSTLPHPENISTCNCYNGNGLAWEDLDDNGITVERRQWKRWEQWAIRRCRIHDPEEDED